MYDSAHFISSRSMSGFHGYPMPEDLPDYPSHRHVLAYLRDFARAYDLYRAIELGTGVEHAAARGRRLDGDPLDRRDPPLPHARLRQRDDLVAEPPRSRPDTSR